MIIISPVVFIIASGVFLTVILVILFKEVTDIFGVTSSSPKSYAPPRQKVPKQPKPKKVKEQKIKEPKKVKEPKRVKEPKPTKAPAPAATATDAQTITKIKQIQHQIASVNSMIKNIDTQFQSGAISQSEYMQKKSFLSEKLGGLQAELDQLRR